MYDEVVRRFGDRGETALLEWVAKAFNEKAFVRLIMAKESWQSPENENEAKSLLSQALADAEMGLEITSEDSMLLGNKGYALFLLQGEEKAEPNSTPGVGTGR